MTSRVVFDTSTLVGAAILPDFIPDQALSRAILFHRVCVSPETLTELGRVLRLKKFDRYIGLGSRVAFFQKLCRDSACHAVVPGVLDEIRGACRDPKDDLFLALAITVHADFIVSSDSDLLVLHPWRGIPILTPAQFLAQSDND
jgi:uncharacterized protein